MAAADLLYEEDLFCPQCSEIYCVPVRLKCGHNVCRVCLYKFWEWKGCRECPVCLTVCVPGRPPVNLALKIAADEYQLRRSSGDQDVCGLHNEKLTLFCQNDEEPVCLLCQMSKEHKVHECCSLEEAAKQKKTEISTMLESIRKKLKTLNKTEEQWRETKTYIQTQALQNEKAIKEEFQKLHQLLWEEEKTRLKLLKQEEEVRTQVMCEKLENIKDQIRGVASIISDIEGALRREDLKFLKDYKKTKKRVKCNIREPECIRDILINSAKHLGSLKFAVCKSMAKIVQYVPITLDPNTAHSNLELSEELTCVQYSRRQLLPDNPERCTSRLCVLGAAGLTSGKHTWTVQVDQSKEWYIGVVRESVQRKSTVFLNPAEGFWVIGLCNGDGFWAQTSPPTKLVLKQRPERITVVLDCDKGKVVFINAADLTTIHTFRDRFTEKIFPYVSTGLYEDDKICSRLTICPLTITLNVE
ncbi:E3 ubiquitin-protein ligase TRIM39-like isoform X2 [Hippoglossus hippoglossus]|uniref:E3 ubiquitin-protein ligase TRIM39-like isoform X2 n=1 Tax=Hippoglossus hippoglossus TaxID=8267 RepID=UPI00148C2A8E|nr:E3 ubiquitin-protein ligase TRIM39-like isoform X2 [Hippoglossus hippoglossus]